MFIYAYLIDFDFSCNFTYYVSNIKKMSQEINL